jgi:DNA-binding NarL/FixJ family response regulator
MLPQTKILVIEDDKQLGKTIKNVLSMHGYDVRYADNGAAGIQKAFEYNPDLILCDINMYPVDGYQVFNVLKDSLLIEQVPFIFITGNSELKDIRFGMDLGVDDYFVKPFDNERLIQTIEKRLARYRKLKDTGKHEFKVLFNMTTNGIFLFDGHAVFETNPALMQMLAINKDDLTTYTIEDFLDPVSYQQTKDKITRCTNGLLTSFCETVTLVPRNGEKFEATLHVSVYEKYSGYSLMVGLVTLDNLKSAENEVFISDIFKLLKKENILVTESLGERLTDIFKRHNVNMDRQESGFFTKRENQVLCLSMEGLPIKVIADKLSISNRTVENHRAKLMEKTNSKNMIEVINFARRNNLIDFKSISFLAVFLVELIEIEFIPFLINFF